jgi:hypothetical protein
LGEKNSCLTLFRHQCNIHSHFSKPFTSAHSHSNQYFRLGFRAIGSDVNAAFVAGAEMNLNYAGLIPEEESEAEAAFSDGISADTDCTTAFSLPLSLSSGRQSHSEALLQLYCKVSGT